MMATNTKESAAAEILRVLSKPPPGLNGWYYGTTVTFKQFAAKARMAAEKGSPKTPDLLLELQGWYRP